MATLNSSDSFKHDRQNDLRVAKKRNFIVYNLYLVSIIASLLGVVGFINWAIDPQDIFKTPNYWKINHLKLTKDNNDRLFKAVDIIRLKPKTIIIGSSRTKQGIDPDSTVLATNDSVYNLALNGPNFYEVRRYIEHAIYNQPNLQQIILGVDFFMFNQSLENQPTFKNSRLEIDRIILDDAVKNLFSIDTLTTSWEIIQASRQAPELADSDYGDDGFMPNRNADNGEAIWRFHQSIKLYFSLHSDYQFSQAYWSDFKQIVELCRQHQIELKVFISPAHATHWESIHATGKWDVFEQWKRELVKLVPVWDFSGYNSITEEPIAKYMENYVDNSHYTPEIGNLILQRIFDRDVERIPSDFGTIIDGKNIDRHLAEIKSDRQKWQAKNPEEVDLVRKFYAQTKQNKNE